MESGLDLVLSRGDATIGTHTLACLALGGSVRATAHERRRHLHQALGAFAVLAVLVGLLGVAQLRDSHHAIHQASTTAMSATTPVTASPAHVCTYRGQAITELLLALAEAPPASVVALTPCNNQAAGQRTRRVSCSTAESSCAKAAAEPTLSCMLQHSSAPSSPMSILRPAGPHPLLCGTCPLQKATNTTAVTPSTRAPAPTCASTLPHAAPRTGVASE